MTRVSCAMGIVLFAGILMATPARAQSTGAIQGNIVDAQGAVVPGVTVTVRNVATGVERTTVSDAGGDYLTPSLAPGLYRIETHLTGFGDQSRDVEVDVARTSVVNIRLTVGPVAESVSVVGASPVIETATTSVGQVIIQRTVQEIPLNGRHFVDLGLLIPGSVTPPQNGFLTRAAARPGLVRVQHRRQPRRHRQLHDQRRQPERSWRRTRSRSSRRSTPCRSSRSTTRRSAPSTAATPARSSTSRRARAPTTSTARRSSSSATTRSTRATSSTAEPAPQSPFKRNQFGAQPRRADRQEQDVLLRHATRACGSARGIDINSGVLSDDQRAAVTDPVSRNLLPLIPTANATGASGEGRFIGSATAPVDIDQWTGDVSHNVEQRRRAARLLRVPARPARRADAAGQHDPRVRRHAPFAPADHDAERDAHLRLESRERGALRLQPHRHHVRAERAS